MRLKKSQASFEIKTYIKGHVNLKMSCSPTYNALCPIHRTAAVSKTLGIKWDKKFKDGFTSPKDGSRTGRSKNVVTFANIAVVAGPIK